MTNLHDLFDDYGQSPWLDNLRRGWITSGELQRWVDIGVRGLTSNPSIFEKAIAGSADYDDEFRSSIAEGMSVEDSYWRLVVSDIEAALRILRPVYDASDGGDGYVSVEVDPGLARDTDGTMVAARALWDTIAEPNLYVKIPGTAEGLAAIEQMIAEKRNINVTLLFSIDRYREVMEAYLRGLERAEGDLSRVSSVASFFISRVDGAVDKALDSIGTPAAQAMKGKTAVANGKLAYRAFLETFSGARWETPPGTWGTSATTALGIDVDEGPLVSRHVVRRHAHRPRHGEHPSGCDARGLPRSRGCRAHRRRRRRARPRPSSMPLRELGVDLDGVARSSKSKVSPRSRRASRRSSKPSTRNARSSDPVLGQSVADRNRLVVECRSGCPSERSLLDSADPRPGGRPMDTAGAAGHLPGLPPVQPHPGRSRHRPQSAGRSPGPTGRRRHLEQGALLGTPATLRVPTHPEGSGSVPCCSSRSCTGAITGAPTIGRRDSWCTTSVAPRSSTPSPVRRATTRSPHPTSEPSRARPNQENQATA